MVCQCCVLSSFFASELSGLLDFSTAGFGVTRAACSCFGDFTAGVALSLLTAADFSFVTFDAAGFTFVVSVAVDGLTALGVACAYTIPLKPRHIDSVIRDFETVRIYVFSQFFGGGNSRTPAVWVGSIASRTYCLRVEIGGAGTTASPRVATGQHERRGDQDARRCGRFTQTHVVFLRT